MFRSIPGARKAATPAVLPGPQQAVVHVMAGFSPSKMKLRRYPVVRERHGRPFPFTARRLVTDDDSRQRELSYTEERAEFKKLEKYSELFTPAVLTSQTFEKIEVKKIKSEMTQMMDEELASEELEKHSQIMDEEDEVVDRIYQDPDCRVYSVGPVHGRVLPVPDAQGKGDVVQREVMFVRTSLSQIELREVEGGVLIFYHRRPIIVSCESPILPALSSDSARCESPVLESSSPILSSSSDFFSPPASE